MKAEVRVRGKGLLSYRPPTDTGPIDVYPSPKERRLTAKLPLRTVSSKGTDYTEQPMKVPEMECGV